MASLEEAIYVSFCVHWDKTWLDKKHIFYSANMKGDAREVGQAAQTHRKVLLNIMAQQKNIPRKSLENALTSFAGLLSIQLNVRYESFGLRSMINWVRKSYHNSKNMARTPEWLQELFHAYKQAPGPEPNPSGSDEGDVEAECGAMKSESGAMSSER